ncbi:MAG: hypothetical protein L0L69_02235 [Propionibacterium sp.]|nr:hypothetical protein [Propionibacterium sp.]
MAADDKIPEVTLVFEDGHREGPSFTQRAHGRSGSDLHDGSGRDRAPMGRRPSGNALPVPPVPVGILGAFLGASALVGIVTTSLVPSTLPAGVASATTFGTAVLPTVFSGVATAVFGPLGMTLLLVAALVSMGRAGRSMASRRLPLLMVMGTAWIATGLVSTVTAAAAAFLVSAVAAVAAAGAGMTMMVPPRWRVAAVVAAVLLTGAVASSLVYTGLAGVIGALVSAVVGLSGAWLGAAIWNRRWAPVMDARERDLEAVRRSAGF